jgi:dolichol-phosphate mannosyltransferase
MPGLTVIVPALNEEDNLRPTVQAVLRELGQVGAPLQVLVFDDASTDRTAEIADQLAIEDPRVHVFHNPTRLNIGGIYKAGVQQAEGEYVVLVPGDNEVPPDQIAHGLSYLATAALVIFYVTNVTIRTWGRRALSRMYVWIVNALFGTRFRYTNGTNIFRTAVIRELPIRTDGFAYQTEAVVKAVRSGADFVQVGLELKARECGASKALSWKNLRSVATALARLWWEVHVADRRRYRRRGRMLGVV